MSERDPNCKRDARSLEASSQSHSLLKKKKLDDDFVFLAVPSPSVASSDDSSRGGCSVTSAGEDDDKSSIICFSSESNEIARKSPTVSVDLETHQISDDLSVSGRVSHRNEANLASEEALGETPEMSKSPTPGEIEEFLSELESKDQKRFMDKYNFDIVNDKPLQGRYKWDRLKPLKE
ncbi:cyclin-dependent kinase inhibitor 6 [Brassica rapa]|uniref:Cyclin-dependent kinase inhibitor domain-containing protein n=1 Tax=Brassica campestris TaxID=3711 RepID=M4CC06_BRACM|nr:cyclin-dependent kinase inhibitor 6 [Brassica rapa]